MTGLYSVIVLALIVVGCRHSDDPSARDGDAGLPSQLDALTTDDRSDAHTPEASTMPDVGDAGENCPSALYPPRTDGCSCFPPTGDCTPAELGKTCDYLHPCPSWASRYRCERVFPKEEPSQTKWVKSNVACPTDAGSD